LILLANEINFFDILDTQPTRMQRHQDTILMRRRA
jgi:hypothetical protein